MRAGWVYMKERPSTKEGVEHEIMGQIFRAYPLLCTLAGNQAAAFINTAFYTCQQLHL